MALSALCRLASAVCPPYSSRRGSGRDQTTQLRSAMLESCARQITFSVRSGHGLRLTEVACNFVKSLGERARDGRPPWTGIPALSERGGAAEAPCRPASRPVSVCSVGARAHWLNKVNNAVGAARRSWCSCGRSDTAHFVRTGQRGPGRHQRRCTLCQFFVLCSSFWLNNVGQFVA